MAAYQAFCILAEGETLESFDNAAVVVDEATTLYLSIGEEIEYSSIVAQVTPVDNDAVLTRADAGGWSAKVAKDAATGNVTVTVTPSDVGYALLDVSLILRDGGKLTASRLLGYGYIYDSSTNTYMVHSVDGLLAWNEAAQSDLSTNCTLEVDIDLTGTEWTPVGTYSSDPSKSSYNGTFDGGNHTITGLTVNQPETNNVGLIGYLGSGGKVQNLTLETVNITGNLFVGGVAGYNDSGIVTACNVSGSISGQSDVGGVVGYNSNSTVAACYWSDYTGNGISTNEDIGETTQETTQVDGSIVTWTDAVEKMNEAIATWNEENPDRTCDWRYRLGDDGLPTLVKE